MRGLNPSVLVRERMHRSNVRLMASAACGFVRGNKAEEQLRVYVGERAVGMIGLGWEADALLYGKQEAHALEEALHVILGNVCSNR
jgi:hypothetical protein